MPSDAILVGRIRDVVASKRGVTEKRMFGGIAFLLNGNMLVGVSRDELIVRVGADSYAEALEEPDVREFDFTGRPMKGWVVVAPEGIEDEDQLRDWLGRAITFVSTLPHK